MRWWSLGWGLGVAWLGSWDCRKSLRARRTRGRPGAPRAPPQHRARVIASEPQPRTTATSVDPVGAAVTPDRSRAHMPTADSTGVGGAGARVGFNTPNEEENPDEVWWEVVREERGRCPAGGGRRGPAGNGRRPRRKNDEFSPPWSPFQGEDGYVGRRLVPGGPPGVQPPHTPICSVPGHRGFW